MITGGGKKKVTILLYFKLGFSELFETNKQIEFVGTGVLDGPQIT